MTDSVPPLPPDSQAPPFDVDPDPSRTGPAWEQPGPFFARFAQTAQAVIVGPTAFFRSMRRAGGVGAPILFGVVGTVVGGVAAAIYQLLLSTMMAGVQGTEAARHEAVLGLFSTGCVVLVLPLGAVLSMFIGSAIYHVMLLLLGGGRRPFETTLRVSAYATGATSLLNLIPICGGIVGGIYAIVAAIIGLAQTHEISTGKAAAAVLLPVVICCGLLILFYGALAALLLGGVLAGLNR
jgi:hypothetical protein